MGHLFLGKNPRKPTIDRSSHDAKALPEEAVCMYTCLCYNYGGMLVPSHGEGQSGPDASVAEAKPSQPKPGCGSAHTMKAEASSRLPWLLATQG